MLTAKRHTTTAKSFQTRLRRTQTIMNRAKQMGCQTDKVCTRQNANQQQSVTITKPNHVQTLITQQCKKRMEKQFADDNKTLSPLNRNMQTHKHIWHKSGQNKGQQSEKQTEGDKKKVRKGLRVVHSPQQQQRTRLAKNETKGDANSYDTARREKKN